MKAAIRAYFTLLILVILFLVWVMIFSVMPATGGTWLTFVEWHQGVRDGFALHQVFYITLLVLVFGGGGIGLALKSRKRK
jgi:hypothetical protein